MSERERTTEEGNSTSYIKGDKEKRAGDQWSFCI